MTKREFPALMAETATFALLIGKIRSFVTANRLPAAKIARRHATARAAPTVHREWATETV